MKICNEIIGAIALAVCTVAGGVWCAIDINNAKKDEAIQPEETVEVAYKYITDIQMGYLIPEGNTSFKTYMDYRSITDVSSDQYKLQNDCWTDANGLRRYGDDYVIAVGSYYADNIGDRLNITLDSGEEFTAVVGDFKADIHTDKSNRFTRMENGDKNVIEFVVDVDALSRKAKYMGDISYISGFDGNVESIVAQSW